MRPQNPYKKNETLPTSFKVLFYLLPVPNASHNSNSYAYFFQHSLVWPVSNFKWLASYSVCFCMSSFFHETSFLWDSSKLLHESSSLFFLIAVKYSILWICHNLLISIWLLMDIWDISWMGFLQIGLPWTILHMPFDVPISVGCIPMVRIAGHRIGLYVCQLK